MVLKTPCVLVNWAKWMHLQTMADVLDILAYMSMMACKGTPSNNEGYICHITIVLYFIHPFTV